jgi:aminocarboxymuconate-semialdehyde decarboxylase
VQIIDTHAHVATRRYREAIEKTGSWYGLDYVVGELHRPEGYNKSIDLRLQEMDATGIDRQLVTPSVGFYQYDKDVDFTITVARECNEDIAEMVDDHPDRFSGLGTLPMQNVGAAIDELTRAMTQLNLKGAIINDHVNGRTYDDPEFLPFFDAAERLGAILEFHQGGGGVSGIGTVVGPRINRYSLPNGIGNMADRTITFSALVFGGVIDKHPGLKLQLAHGGGYTAFGIGRLDKVAGAFEGGYPDGPLTPPFVQPADQYRLNRAPSTYLSAFHYDCITYDGDALRFLIDKVGIENVMLGTDYPAPMLLIESVRWIDSLPQLTDEEKRMILRDNPSAFLSL